MSKGQNETLDIGADRSDFDPTRRRTIDEIAVGETIQDFQLILELGRGAFARVFLARQVSMQRVVALKISGQRSVESPLLCQLDHPNIVRVYDERCADGLTLLYMQYIPGNSLRQIIQAAHTTSRTLWTGSHYVEQIATTLRSRGETPTQLESNNTLAHLTWGETVAWIGARIANALEHAHSKGVWHRDIKPENILVAADGRPMLADFNLSFGAGIDTSHRQEEFGGSYPYMSPEQIDVLLCHAKPESVKASSDVYSLAIVLWELLVGSRPFPDTSRLDPLALQELRRYRSHVPRIEGRYECPKGLRQAIGQSLSIDSEVRPTAKQLYRTLLVCTFSEIQLALYPEDGSQIAKWQAHPIGWLILLGLIPNTLVAGLNIWANSRLTINHFDQKFFRETELIPVNLVSFTVGVLVSFWIVWPIAAGFQSIRRAQPMTAEARHRVIMRCLSSPLLSACNILLLFSLSGIVFPLWNRLGADSQVTTMDAFGFFVSQVLHGLVAAGLTFVITSLVTLRAFYPKFMSLEESTSQQFELDRFEKQFLRVTNLMALTPLLALLVLAIADHIDKFVFVALATAGFASHLLSTYLTPRIRSCIRVLRFALSPTSELLQRHGK